MRTKSDWKPTPPEGPPLKWWEWALAPLWFPVVLGLAILVAIKPPRICPRAPLTLIERLMGAK